jgi:hypothetical protein
MSTNDNPSRAIAFRIPGAGLMAVAVFGTLALGTFKFIASSIAARPDIRGALFMRSAYEDPGSEVVRQYRVALKRQSKAELCVFAGMIASVYAHAHDERAALAWKEQEGRDCAAAGMESIWSDVRATR